MLYKSISWTPDGCIVKVHGKGLEEKKEKSMSHIYRKIDNLNMWVGDETAYLTMVASKADNAFDLIVQAAKEPYHRKAVGYTGQGAPLGPEYLSTRRQNRLILNLIDPARGHFIRQSLVDAVVAEISLRLDNGENVFVHCNKGESRAPSLAFLVWVAKQDLSLKGTKDDMDKLIGEFSVVYPEFKPSEGLREFIYFYGPDYIKFNKRWEKLCLM